MVTYILFNTDSILQKWAQSKYCMYLCFCSSSLEEEDEQEQTEEEDESNIVFKSDHEFSPESDLENEDAEVQPTRRARTAQKGKLPSRCYETFSFITASVIILQICRLHSHFPRSSYYYWSSFLSFLMVFHLGFLSKVVCLMFSLCIAQESNR